MEHVFSFLKRYRPPLIGKRQNSFRFGKTLILCLPVHGFCSSAGKQLATFNCLLGNFCLGARLKKPRELNRSRDQDFWKRGSSSSSSSSSSRGVAGVSGFQITRPKHSSPDVAHGVENCGSPWTKLDNSGRKKEWKKIIRKSKERGAGSGL